MKKLLLCATLAIIAFTNAQSQEVRFGGKIGLNVSSLGGDKQNANGDPKVGFHLGGVWEISFSEKFALQPEALFSLEVYEYNYPTTSYDVKSSYIRIPLLAKYYIIDGLSAEAGPSIGFLIASKIKDDRVKDSFKTFDAEFAVGTTYELNMGVFVSARYNLGLMNINNIKGSDFKNQANTIQISLGYFF